MRTTRREFAKFIAASGIALSLSRLALADEPEFDVRETLPGRKNWNPAATGRGRIDAAPKVTGAKFYASDFRAVDLPGWPSRTAHAVLVRAPDATHVYAGLDLSHLTGVLKPSVVVTASDLKRIRAQVPGYYAGDLFCPVGKTPLYLGQPVALLIYEEFDHYDQARTVLRDFHPAKFGKETGPVVGKNYGAFRFTRVAGSTPDAPDIHSPLKDGWVSPGFFKKNQEPVWKRLPVPTGQAYVKAASYGEKIRAELRGDNPSLLVLDREFATQSVDPMFLEPECGLAWYDAKSKELALVLGVQSPYEAAGSIETLLGKARANFKPKKINAHFAAVGGGFGGRDHTPFPLYVALAAMFLPGQPVRLAHDRYQQFQSGIKRHPFKIRTRIGIDKSSGKITAFAGDHVLDGGGLANFSASVAVVGANGAIGVYDIPKVDITTVALHSRAVTAGSMRGYGTLQTMTALEVLIDEAASTLGIDPIDFRRRNALKPGGRTLAGNTYAVSVRTPEILEKLERHPIWRQRAEEKARGGQKGVLVGTGVACVTKDYGGIADCSLSSVEIDQEGRISIYSDQVEMGNGIGTALANRVAAHLGGVADQVLVANIKAFSALELVASVDPDKMDQKTQDSLKRNPRWVPAISSSSAASEGAHVGTHAANEAARIIFQFGLWPAALDLWGLSATDPRAAQSLARWEGGQLVAPGLRPLPLSEIAAKAHAKGGVTAAMGHSFCRWAWSRATFDIHGHPWAAELDALAIREGAGDFIRLDRKNVEFPPMENLRFGSSYTSLCGTLVRVEIERASGALRIAKAYSVFECGKPLTPEIVIGQAQGGFAMGVGYTLLESLPPYEDGPGNGQWNLDQYTVARGSNLPLQALEIEMLPPLPNERPKGMAEVVMIPVVPALLNAIFDATGRRFNSLPVTQSMLKEALT
ncbi:xanthine dehydrogenase family protein molybdopterin-binding subunit [Methylocystis echinoides]|uniref:Oxidoreductase n=1 Tax=Methylocystis echinoides TaxID=29468 RepID=A0A9W6LTJ4_9HYPH|nr:molybdopterin cofactor-binding domain-containing protein [Methylocystis echinoides]GLI94703.1 oxidoreductase [Methylocystis echinoides]